MSPGDILPDDDDPGLPVPDGLASPARRRLLKWMAASTALAGAGCGQPPPEPILPYVSMPERLATGQPVFYATTLRRHGMGIGVLVETESGRPTKIEGNRLHPASLGATGAQTQAAILDLWDPERSRVVLHKGQISAWSDFLAAMTARLQAHKADDGSGLRLLTGPMSSPTLLSQIRQWQSQFPLAQWHRHQANADAAAEQAARQVFGSAIHCVYHLERAKLIISLGADLFSGPDGVRNAQGFATARRAGNAAHRPRLYAFETMPGLCGALADTRRALGPAAMEDLLQAIAAKLQIVPRGPSNHSALSRQALDKLCKQLLQARGASIIAAGPALSAHAHALAWRLNDYLGNLGNTIVPLADDSAWPDTGAAAVAPKNLASLIAAMRAGDVATLVMLDVNPVYGSPVAAGFRRALEGVNFTAHMGLYPDETAQASQWHIPMAHELEDWSDALSQGQAASIVQPVISPLYGGYSPHMFMDVVAGGLGRSAHACVRATWQALWPDSSVQEFEQRWLTALRHGVISDQLLPAPKVMKPLRAADIEPAAAQAAAACNDDAMLLTAAFCSDPNIDTIDQANNAWLQELPRPYTKLTWDNAALISAATAAWHGLQNGDVVELTATEPDAMLHAPVWILPGHADSIITLPLGYGRYAAGSTGNGVGFNAYALQGLDDQGHPSPLRRVQIKATGERYRFARSQHFMRQEGRDIARAISAASLQGDAGQSDDARAPAETTQRPSLYPPRHYDSYAWGMTVDLDACIGCNACTIACQAENNIPVVGRERVSEGREMHWIRIDLYYDEDTDPPRFQPMACQHCENAPCEVVCPVGATMHDAEGLNVQVYNRCVGTRFCSNNCPYKVRRFNFFKYSDDSLSAKAHQNPDVTVRQRGVMEKCTYCVQRISHARIEAQKAGRAIADGDVVTACEAVCSTQAIVFGDLNDPDSRVSRSRGSGRSYAALDELNTRPRTRYLARIVDAAGELEEDHD